MTRHLPRMPLALLLSGGLLLASCAQSPSQDESDLLTSPAETSQEESSSLSGVKRWQPGTYLPEDCEEVSPDAPPVFDDLISEADAVNCVAPLTAEISMGAEIVTAERAGENLYGVSQYLRVYRLLDKVPTIGQFGQWGQWIGNDAHHASQFNSIEGGLFVHDKMGRSYYPKYMASAATHLYSPDSDTGGGWGFYERRISCDVLGRITLSNRVIPHMISFDEDQETYEDDGGISVGTSWVALPLIDGAERSERIDNSGQAGGLLTWTFVIDSANYSGPLIAYAPQHWNLRIERWNALEFLNDVFEWNPGESVADPAGQALADFVNGDITEEAMLALIQGEQWYQEWWADTTKTHGVSPAGRYVPTGIEMPPVPVFTAEEDGRTFVKVFPPQVPHSLDQESLALNVQTFGVDLYNSYLDAFSSGSSAASWDTTFDSLGIPMTVERNRDKEPLLALNHLEPRGEDYYADPNVIFTIPLLASQENGETNIVFDWSDISLADRTFSTYYEVMGSSLVAVEASDVPEKLTWMEYGNLESPSNLRNHLDNLELEPGDTFDTKCWECDDPNGCDPEVHETTLDDGSVVRYRWYRFSDQPVFYNMTREYPEAYSEAKLEQLQATIETMHQEWDGTVNLLERPTSTDAFHLAEVDHGLIVDPPAGKEVGWVPIVIEVEHPDGEWIDEPHMVWSDRGSWPRR